MYSLSNHSIFLLVLNRELFSFRCCAFEQNVNYTCRIHSAAMLRQMRDEISYQLELIAGKF